MSPEELPKTIDGMMNNHDPAVGRRRADADGALHSVKNNGISTLPQPSLEEKRQMEFEEEVKH